MSSSLARIWKLTAGSRVRYGAAVVSLIIASCFLYLTPLVPQVAIDGVILVDGEPPPIVRRIVDMLGGRSFLAERLWLLGLLIVSLTAIAGVFTYLRGRWSAQASETIVRRVRDEVYDHLQRLPCSYFDQAETGDLVQRCTSDVETLRLFLANQVVEIGRASVMLLVPIPFMLALDVRMTVVSVLLLPVIVAFSIGFFLRVRRIFRATDEAEGRLTATLQENLTGIRVVRAFARQAYECERFRGRNDEHRELDLRLYKLLAWFWASSDLMCLSQKALVLGAGAYWLADGSLSIGVFYYFITAVSMFIWPVRMMGRILADLGKATVALGRLHEVLETSLESTASPSAPAAVGSGEIVFDRVSFAHGEESPVLRGISFHIRPGQTLGILGPSGCGKSTIVSLLLRLYDYDGGSIRLGGHELGELDRHLVRGQTAVVLQEPFLFTKSLRDNISMGRPSATEEELVESTTVACVHDTILEFEQGYDTLIGERGVTLSGGQRQRVALARALVREPAVLILDDSLSAVDAETESLILGALRQRRGRHTTIVIAHRISAVSHADQIIVLDHGRIVQRGTHRELVSTPGLYRRLWAIQTSLDEDLHGAEFGVVTSAEQQKTRPAREPEP